MFAIATLNSRVQRAIYVSDYEQGDVIMFI